MKRWRRWADWAVVWLISLLIDGAVAVLQLIRRRNRGGGGTA